MDTLEAYRWVFKDCKLLRGFVNSALVTEQPFHIHLYPLDLKVGCVMVWIIGSLTNKGLTSHRR